MPEGPAGIDRPFVSDKRTILVLIGIDSVDPPVDVKISTREAINSEINKKLIQQGADIDINRSTVELTIEDNPSNRQRDALGPKTLHVQQYDVKTELDEVSQEFVNAVHNEVVDKVRELGFNVTGTKTTIR